MMLSQSILMVLHLCMPLQNHLMYIEAHIDVGHGCKKLLSSRIQEW